MTIVLHLYIVWSGNWHLIEKYRTGRCHLRRLFGCAIFSCRSQEIRRIYFDKMLNICVEKCILVFCSWFCRCVHTWCRYIYCKWPQSHARYVFQSNTTIYYTNYAHGNVFRL